MRYKTKRSMGRRVMERRLGRIDGMDHWTCPRCGREGRLVLRTDCYGLGKDEWGMGFACECYSSPTYMDEDELKKDLESYLRDGTPPGTEVERRAKNTCGRCGAAYVAEYTTFRTMAGNEIRRDPELVEWGPAGDSFVSCRSLYLCRTCIDACDSGEVHVIYKYERDAPCEIAYPWEGMGGIPRKTGDRLEWMADSDGDGDKVDIVDVYECDGRRYRRLRWYARDPLVMEEIRKGLEEYHVRRRPRPAILREPGASDMTGRALLIDVDSKIPNLALMHISAWRRSEGLETGWDVEDPDEVWASIVFEKNRHACDGLAEKYPNAKIDIGGGGYDYRKHLPEEVDLMMPDYSIYPSIDYSVGFTTRGCDRNCFFCHVREKEGRFRVVQHPSGFHDRRFKKTMILDNNILLDKTWFFEVTDWLIENKVKADICQGLDIRLMDAETAKRLAVTPMWKPLHFAFDSEAYEDKVVEGIDILNRNGVKCRNRAMFYVYCDGDHDFESALYRCKRLRELNVMPYLMRNRNAEQTRRMTVLSRWCRPWFFFKVPWEDFARTYGVEP